MNKTSQKVELRNWLNSLVNQYVPLILADIAPFKGQKVVLQSGGLANKIKQVFDKYTGLKLANTQIWVSVSRYSISINFKVWLTIDIDGRSNTEYQEQTIYLIDLNGLDFDKLYEFVPLKTDYNYEEIQYWRAEYQKADEIKRKMQSNLEFFGLY